MHNVFILFKAHNKTKFINFKLLVDKLIRRVLVERVVENERLIFQILRQVHLVLWLVNDQRVLRRNGQDIDVFLLYLCKRQGDFIERLN